MIKDIRPKEFIPRFEVVSCFIEYNKKILLLKRQSYKPQPNTYGLPAGKIDNGETPIEALIREIKEETGIELLEQNVSYYKTKYVEYDQLQFIYHMFHCDLKVMPIVVINPNEHQEYLWVSPKNSLKLDLIKDEDHCIMDYYKIKKG